MNAIKIAIHLPQNIANVIANDACAADLIVNFFFRCLGAESVRISCTNDAPQYYVEGDVFYAVAENPEESHVLRARLLEGRPKYDGEYIVIDDALLRALGFKESTSELIEYAAVFGNQQSFWQQERLRACPRE